MVRLILPHARIQPSDGLLDVGRADLLLAGEIAGVSPSSGDYGFGVDPGFHYSNEFLFRWMLGIATVPFRIRSPKILERIAQQWTRRIATVRM